MRGEASLPEKSADSTRRNPGAAAGRSNAVQNDWEENSDFAEKIDYRNWGTFDYDGGIANTGKCYRFRRSG